MSVSTENFIKTIYALENSKSKDSRPGTVAAALGVSSAAATDMSRKMASRGLINYIKYKPITLTDEGEKMALLVIRKHRLWELFLHETFGMSMLEIHREAEMLEHMTSDFLAEKISAFLGDPKYDPHGDPIPAPDGTVALDPDRILMAEASPGADYLVSRLYTSSREILGFCELNDLRVGTIIQVERQYITTRMTEIRIQDKTLILNEELTQTIYLTHKF